MQQLCYLFTLGDKLHILGGYDTQLDNGNGINYNGSADGNTHYQRHYNSAARRSKQHAAIIHSQRYNAHYKAGHGGTDEDILNGKAVFKAAVYKYEVERTTEFVGAIIDYLYILPSKISTFKLSVEKKIKN